MSESQQPCRFVLITGTSTGIGRASALRLARSGLAVLAGVRSDADGRAIEAAARDALASNGAHGGRLAAVQLDVSCAASVAAAAERVRSICAGSGLCGLVNNAGICVVGPAECVGLDDWRRQFEVNFFGAIAVSQAMLPLLRQHVAVGGRWSARIVNISSVTGQVASPLFGPYSASKFALEALSDAMRLELRAHGIALSLINPGTIQSEIWRKEKDGVAALADGSSARELYSPMIDNVASFVFRAANKAIPADRVACAVERCLTRRRPPNRLRIGWEAHVGYRAKNLLPEWLFDFLMCRTLGVPRG